MSLSNTLKLLFHTSPDLQGFNANNDKPLDFPPTFPNPRTKLSDVRLTLHLNTLGSVRSVHVGAGWRLVSVVQSRSPQGLLRHCPGCP